MKQLSVTIRNKALAKSAPLSDRPSVTARRYAF